MIDILSSIHKAATILLPKKHLFLLSHMRSYTSLFGHILGSNPDICGYYEMHIGYYSWKSLIRQKLLYFSQETLKPGFTYMFDKVLHNEHCVSPDILNSGRTKTIFCLRHPQEVIPSILKLYQGIDPAHEFNSEAFATQYYIRRLAMLEDIADSLKQNFFYLDAESLKLDSENCLRSLSNWLCLETPLSATYEMQRNTSRQRYGDSSARLKAGRITNDRQTYLDFEHDPELLRRAIDAHTKARNHLMRSSTHQCVTERVCP